MIILPRLDIAVSDKTGSILLVHPERLEDLSDHPLANPFKFEGAAKAIRRLRAGWRPGDDRLDRAPRLENWSFLELGAGIYVLTGAVAEHPRLGTIPNVRTSLLVGLDATNLKWARTLSRFYRLGTPRPESHGARKDF